MSSKYYDQKVISTCLNSRLSNRDIIFILKKNSNPFTSCRRSQEEKSRTHSLSYINARASWNSIRYSNPRQTSLPEISIVSKISIELRRQRKPPPLLHRYNIGRGEARDGKRQRGEKKEEKERKTRKIRIISGRMKPEKFLHFLSRTRFV